MSLAQKTRKAAVTPGISQPNIHDMLIDLIRAFGYDPGLISVDDLQSVAGKLSVVAGKSPEWGWRYLRNILNGKLEASRQIAQAIMALGAVVDGTHPLMAASHPVQVFARGDVKSGAIVLASSRRCANPACPIEFVPVVPRQRFCCVECRKGAHGRYHSTTSRNL